jgi:MFS superfamily sulfate permease-like transporter
VRWLIVDAAAITDIDYSAARMLLDLRVELRRKGVDMAFARVVAPLRADMDRHGITAAVGAQRIFPALHEALAALKTMGSEL